MNITVFERSDYIGGRSTTVNVWNNPEIPIELGASIFVKVNRNLISAVKEFGLYADQAGIDTPRVSPDALGIWDGNQFKFVQEEGTSFWWDLTRLIWKYGLTPIRTHNLMKQTVDNFLKLYETPHFPFRSLSQASYDVGLASVTSLSGSMLLRQNDILPPFSTDIIQASTRVNYAQNLDQIHGLETMVCMATDGAVAVRGGNWQIFSGMLRAAEASVLLNTTVRSIAKRNVDRAFQIRTETLDGKSVTEHIDSFDSVIIAAPLQFSDIDLFTLLDHTPEKIDYVQLQVTLLATPYTLSPKAFNMLEGKNPPNVILTTLPNDAQTGQTPSPFFSISTLRKLENRKREPVRVEYVYKIFSTHPLKLGMVTELFDIKIPELSRDSPLEVVPEEHISWMFEQAWHSYPYLTPRITFEESQLAEDLWYTGGIESFISTMETSSLMGMNVAKLVSVGWEATAEKQRILEEL